MPPPASISTRLDEQEFLELADSYYITPRHEITDNPSRTGSTTTLSTNQTHLRRRDMTPSGPRWRPSTLKEYEGSCGRASGQVDDQNYVQGQNFSHMVIDPRRGLLTTSTSMSLESYRETFRTAKGPVGSLNTLPQQIPQIDPVLRSSFSLPTKTSRSISTASLASKSCFSIICFPRWSIMKASGKPAFRLGRRQQQQETTQSITRGTAGESSGPANAFSIIPLDSGKFGEGYVVSLPSRGLASASSPLVGLDYDYHLAVEVLINGFDVEPKPPMP